ncbi:MAG: hypothetical protein HXX14_19585 [Bacteroidetes bacterium]|nr:hypothetical protein [Bacteroidota bacterium]
MKDFNIVTIDKGASSEITREKFSLDQQGISNWLNSKNIISDNETLSSYQDLIPWVQTGGETYCTSFEFSTNKQTKQINIKVLVTFSPEKSLQDWARRRKFIYENGIKVSNWYHFGEAVIIEDFYPNTFQDVTFEKLLAIGLKLDQLGFTTLKYIDDIRADVNGNPFFIDFGFDLGEPSGSMKTSAKEYLLRQFPHRLNEINRVYE